MPPNRLISLKKYTREMAKANNGDDERMAKVNNGDGKGMEKANNRDGEGK